MPLCPVLLQLSSHRALTHSATTATHGLITTHDRGFCLPAAAPRPAVPAAPADGTSPTLSTSTCTFAAASAASQACSFLLYSEAGVRQG